jgi:phosphatidylglycerophosphate synthase
LIRASSEASSRALDTQQALTPTDFYASIRGGGGWWSLQVSNRLASIMAAKAHQLGLKPNQVTALNGALGVATSTAAIVLRKHPAAASLIAFSGWQTAYALDCADGQLARATGQTSEGGALLDVLCDFGVQVSVAAAGLALTWSDLDAPVAVLLGGGLTFGLFDATVANLLMPRSRGKVVEVTPARFAARSVRDYGSFVAVLPALMGLQYERLARVLLTGRAAVDTAFVLGRVVGLMRRPGVEAA